MTKTRSHTQAHAHADTNGHDAPRPQAKLPEGRTGGSKVPDKQLQRWANEGGALPPDEGAQSAEALRP